MVPNWPMFDAQAKLTTITRTALDLQNLPQPRGKILTAVYDFPDKTGQYKRSPASSYSTAVPQGATAVLTKALWESNWFIPVEREGLNNLLTERKIILSRDQKALPYLTPANILIEGSIIAYDTNLHTGGVGASYLGIGASGRYQTDQITVNVRAIDIATGQVLATVNTSKTVISTEVRAGVFRYLDYKKLLSGEGGTTYNEPVQLCLTAAIETAVIHLIIQGIEKQIWQLQRADDWQSSPIFSKYLAQASDP